MPCNPPDLGAVKWLLRSVRGFNVDIERRLFKASFFCCLMAGVWWMKEKNILFKNFQIIIIWYICCQKYSK